jgi:hypothetical protein
MLLEETQTVRQTLLLLAVLMGASVAIARPAAATDLALVLLTDVSRSMDDDEYEMVKAGYRAAFNDPEVVAAILGVGGVAVAYVEFSGEHEIALVKGWDLLTDSASAGAFGEAVALAPRSSAGNTALAAGIKQAARLLTEGDFGAARLVIDVTSDHPSDGGRTAGIRDAAVANGITINALPIISNDPIGTFDGRMTYTAPQWGLGGALAFYNRDVIGGANSFVVEANDFSAFAEALKRKLLLELVASR